MATHLLNHLPLKAIQNDTPHFKLFQTQPTYNHLRVFRCICYPHLHPPHKLAPCSTPSIFLGYPDNHRGFRCLDLNTRKIIISRHVVFSENVFPFLSMTPNHPHDYHFLEDITPPNPIATRMLLSKTINPTSTTQPNNSPPSTASSQSASTHPTTPSRPTTTSSSESTPLVTATPSLATPLSSPPPTSATHHTPSVTSPSPTLSPSSITTSPPPPEHPHPPTSTHPMTTRLRHGISKPVTRLNLHTASLSPIPKTPQQALCDPNWKNVMHDEYNVLIENDTWRLVPRPTGVNIVRSMWLFNVNLILMALLAGTRRAWWLMGKVDNKELTVTRLLVRLLSWLPFGPYLALQSHATGPCTNLM